MLSSHWNTLFSTDPSDCFKWLQIHGWKNFMYCGIFFHLDSLKWFAKILNEFIRKTCKNVWLLQKTSFFILILFALGDSIMCFFSVLLTTQSKDIFFLWGFFQFFSLISVMYYHSIKSCKIVKIVTFINANLIRYLCISSTNCKSKFRYSEKAQELEKNISLCFDVT